MFSWFSGDDTLAQYVIIFSASGVTQTSLTSLFNLVFIAVKHAS